MVYILPFAFVANLSTLTKKGGFNPQGFFGFVNEPPDACLHYGAVFFFPHGKDLKQPKLSSRSDAAEQARRKKQAEAQQLVVERPKVVSTGKSA